MHLPTLLTALLPLLPIALSAPALRGFNIASNNHDGSCKTVDDWTNTFRRIATVPGSRYRSARIYSTSDCNALALAVPAALNTGTTLLVGIWTQDSAKYSREKDALLSAISAYGSSWLIAVTVGSEDLYRKETSADALATQIYDVRGMLRSKGVGVQVGHVDTWTAWVDPANDAVTRAVDFVGVDSYPYFQAARIGNAVNVFMKSLKATRDRVAIVKPGADVWVTETGWPVAGDTFGGKSVASPENARKYWRGLVCSGLLKGVNLYWYIDADGWMTPSFGMFDENSNRIYGKVKC